MTDVTVRPLEAGEAAVRLDELADILVDAVAHGASVNFLAGFTAPEARMFWQDQNTGLRSGERRLFVAEAGGRLVGTVLLIFAQQPNQAHRADIGKMLVLSSCRRSGLGLRLLAAAETAARASRRTLLMLDTETGSAGDLLYRRAGWTAFGTVPGHAMQPGGDLAPTTFFYKILE